MIFVVCTAAIFGFFSNFRVIENAKPLANVGELPMVTIFYDDRFLEHLTGAGHPERPDRLLAIRQAIAIMPEAGQISWERPTAISSRSPLPWIEQVHTAPYLRSLRQICAAGGGHLDGDTPVSEQSYEVALLAVNAWMDGIDQARKGLPCFVAAEKAQHTHWH